MHSYSIIAKGLTDGQLATKVASSTQLNSSLIAESTYHALPEVRLEIKPAHQVKPQSQVHIDSSARIHWGSFIHGGSFGQVYKGEWNKQPAAIKKFRNSSEEEIFEEAAMLNQLQITGCTVKYFGLSYTRSCCAKKYCIGMEYIPGGSVIDWIGKGVISNPERAVVLTGIAEKLATFHNFGYIHCDLKPDNIMLKNYTFIDVSFSLKLNLDQKFIELEFPRGTPEFAAPEIFSNNRYSYKSDIYAFGSIIFMVYENQYPEVYPNDSHFSRRTPPEVQALIALCWQTNPASRPTATNVVDELRKISALSK